jgi:hypothetical protein
MRDMGNDVRVLDLYPEFNSFDLDKVEQREGSLYYDNTVVVTSANKIRECGNYDKDRYYKGLLRVGLPWKILEDELSLVQYDVIMVQCTFTYHWEGAHEAIEICKKLQPGAKVVLGGAYTNLCYNHAKRSMADEIAIGRIDKEKYFIPTNLDLLGYKPSRIQVQTSYGCRNRCKYCAVTVLEGGLRVERPIQDVLDFIRLSHQRGFKYFRFLDSNVLDNWGKHFRKILEGIIEMDLGLDFTVYGGVETNLLTDEMAKLMKRAGFSKITIPLESAEESVLREWGRTNDIDKFRAAVAIARKYFLMGAVHAYIMVGYPGQTYESAIKSIRLCEEIECTPEVLAFTPIPGTPLEMRSKNLEDLNPMLWPCAWDGFTAIQMENIFAKYVKNFSSSILCSRDLLPSKTIYKTSSPIFPASNI